MHPIAKTSSIVLLVVIGCLIITYKATSQQTDYSQLKSQAEQQYSSGSYAGAHETYSRINLEALSAAEKRWVLFRLADTRWRSQAATQTSDTSKFEQAQKELEEIVRAKDQEDERDFIWAEAHESLGDFFWTRSSQTNWSAAWPHYQQALEWWAGQRDINQARDRYLKIVFKADYPARQNPYYYYTYYGNTVPLNILENALKISQKEEDKVHLHYLIAMTMRHQGGDWEMRQRVADEFEAALAGGRKTEWHDDALYHYAEWMNQTGTLKQNEKGEWVQQPDYVKALELFRRLTREFAKGETRYYDQAQSQINTITEPQLGIYVSNIFLPESELQFVVNARNIKRVNYALYKVNLTRDVRFTKNPAEEEGEGQDGGVDWIRAIQLGGRPAVKSWSEELPIRNEHQPINKETRVDGRLPVGAYLLEAKAGSQTVRDVLLVTDTAILLKTSGKQALVYYSHAVSGAPISNAGVSLWESYYNRDNKWRWRRLTKLTNTDGLAVFDLKGLDSHRNLFIAAESNDRQSFSAGYSYQHHQEGDAWRIYAYTDRPAYRPKETVQWKFVARRFANGEYSTPANQILEYQITDARGTKVTEGKTTLNAFGSAWGSIELTDQNALGEYNIQFWNDGRTQGIGGARLFRVEEFKLPEFKVAVKTPEENGKKKAFRLREACQR